MANPLVQACEVCGTRRSVTVADCHVCAARASDDGQEHAADAQPDAAGFDPAARSVLEVLEYLEGLDLEDPERARVLEAERAGKARKGVLGDAAGA